MSEWDRLQSAWAEGTVRGLLAGIRQWLQPSGLHFKIDRIRVTDFGKQRMRTIVTARIIVRNRDPEAIHLDSLTVRVKEIDEELVPGHLDPQYPKAWVTDFDPILIPSRESKRIEVDFSKVGAGFLNHTNPTLSFEAEDSLGRAYRIERLLFPSAPVGHVWSHDESQEWLHDLDRFPDGKRSIIADDLDRLSRSLARMRAELLDGYEKTARRKMNFKISEEDLDDLRALKELWEFKLNDGYEVAWGYFLGQIARAVKWSSETGYPVSIT